MVSPSSYKLIYEGLVKRRIITRRCYRLLFPFWALLSFFAGLPYFLPMQVGPSILHEIPEGHVEVYWTGGALSERIAEPGFRVKWPFITRFELVQVTHKTDIVRDVPCGTNNGVIISFDRIEIVNRLKKDFVYQTMRDYGVHYDKTWIHDKIPREINRFCSVHTLHQVYIDTFDQIDDIMKDALQADCTRYAPGIEILSVRVTKPTIPNTIHRNFLQMEEERMKFSIAVEKQRVSEKEAETRQKIALHDAMIEAQVSEKETETHRRMAISIAEKDVNISEMKLKEKENAKREAEIANAMFIDREKSVTDASSYRALKEAEANKLKLTPEFLNLKFIEALANNSKIFFEGKMASTVFYQRLLGIFGE